MSDDPEQNTYDHEKLPPPAASLRAGTLWPGNTNAATYYWVGGSGNWSDYATHWQPVVAAPPSTLPSRQSTTMW